MSGADQGDRRGQPSLRHAMGVVQQQAIAPLVRLCLTAPDAMAKGDAHARFKARRLELEAEVAKALADEGAFVAYGGAQARITFAGVTGSSTQGLLQAVQHCRSIAHRSVHQREGRGR